ncbi:hypothetical protein RJ639_034292 [Escallonia herrerae]|uniref:BZIP domain-containing protein n=1 Tax=Escallonia herrerae TaxID=1293975 RepID=A0AA89BEV5_9ASTE|nr:hypothetical protein RJ639_034292 [Escallonia herrerae]
MSALGLAPSSSTSEADQKYAMMDERKRKRMISNRDSARRSRMKRQMLVQDLTNEASGLQVANNGIMEKIDESSEACRAYMEENNVLRAQATELTDRLRCLNDLLEISGVPVDVPEIPDPLLRPWQLPCQLQPITASSGLFQFD